MSTDILNTWTQPLQPAIEAVRELNRRSVAYLEQLASLQQGSLQTHTDRLLANLKAGTDIDDLEAFKAYVSRQPEVVREALEQFIQDSQVLAELNTRFYQESSQSWSDQSQVVAERTRTAARKTVKKVA